MVTVNFPGGATGSNSPYFDYASGWYASQRGTSFPNANMDVNGEYPVLITSINPQSVTGTTKIRLRFGGVDYSANQIVPAAASNGDCAIIIYSVGNQVGFKRNSTSQVPNVKLYTPDDVLNYTWGSQMSGTWSYALVPTAVTNVQVTIVGLAVTVSYTAPSSNGGADISAYVTEYSSSADGVTYGSYTAFTNGSSLPSGLYHKVRVYAINAAGASEAGVSSPFYLQSLLRCTTSSPVAYAAITGTGTSKLQRYGDTPTSGWNNITYIKRYDGTTWNDIFLKL